MHLDTARWLPTLPSLFGVEVAICDYSSRFAGLNRNNANHRLCLCQRPRLYLFWSPFRTCTHSKKKLRLKSCPDKTYLFVTVIRIDEPQYARTGTIGLFETEMWAGADGILGGCGRSKFPSFRSPSSMA